MGNATDNAHTRSLIQPTVARPRGSLAPHLRAVGLVEHGDAVELALGEPCTEAVRAARIGLASEERLEGLPAGRQLCHRARAAAEALTQHRRERC